MNRLRSEWLPAFCADPKRQYDPSGFKDDSVNVAEVDAENFLRAFDSGLVTDIGGGRYRCAMSKASEQLFWTGAKGIDPRPLTLWIEPVITIASVARLHLDYSWLAELLGMQSVDWAFDFATYEHAPDCSMLIAGEVKKSAAELKTLVTDLWAYSRSGATAPDSVRAGQKNSFRKWAALLECEAPLFWAVGPNGESHLFKLHYSDATAMLSEISLTALEAGRYVSL